MKLIYEQSRPGRRGVRVPECSVPRAKARIPARLRRKEPAALPEVSELDVIRHYTNLSRLNFSVDTNYYPLGSCTMKYNPKVCEKVARLDGFAKLHPLLPQLRNGGMLTQGALKVLYELERMLAEVTGMAEMTLQPMAGANGELTGAMIIAAYHAARGNDKKRFLIPDSAHGTNPATAAIAGYGVTPIPSDGEGCMDLKALEKELSDDVAGVMLTAPNTLGLFEKHVQTICRLVHEVDGLMYCDGANMNAFVGRVRPGDLGFDVVHLNLHKTFATPHGGGGPGAGAVGVVEKLRPFLPISRVIKRDDGTYALDYEAPQSIGYIAPFYGNFGVLLRAYAYLRMLGAEGLREVSTHAVLNANYVRVKLREKYETPYDRMCMHECVISARRQERHGVRALDIAKALLDRGFHAPTVYFPLIVHEALMIEPTETESKETLDAFIAAMEEIAELAETEPARLHAAPVTTPVGRLDEAAAAREMILTA
ncbi:MAG: aminomethyl-transferring glycine dehydrogenase subunit GcvPB [bacterium]|nr:aminomethyl-transferring glycine dehydrogenase subunit GcvPB [bacterium]